MAQSKQSSPEGYFVSEGLFSHKVDQHCQKDQGKRAFQQRERVCDVLDEVQHENEVELLRVLEIFGKCPLLLSAALSET